MKLKITYLMDNFLFVASKTHSFGVRQHINFIGVPDCKTPREVGGESLVQS